MMPLALCRSPRELETVSSAEEGLRNMLAAIACNHSVLDAQRFPSGVPEDVRCAVIRFVCHYGTGFGL